MYDTNSVTRLWTNKTNAVYPYLDTEPSHFPGLSPNVHYSTVLINALDWISNVNSILD
jgi:hypothetical protein